MTSRIHRLERDLAQRPTRRRRRSTETDAQPVARSTSISSGISTGLSVDAGGPIDLVCDVPQRTTSNARSFSAFAFEAMDDLPPETQIASTVDVSVSPAEVARVSGPTPPTPDNGQAGMPPSQQTPSAPAAPAPAPTPTRAPAQDEDLGGWTLAGGATPDGGASESTVFAQDIAAILAHTQREASESSAMATASSAPSMPSAPQPAYDSTPPPGIGAVSGHDIFDRMAAANFYDQGPVAFSVDFSAMDRAIDRGVTTPPPLPNATTAAPIAPPTPAPIAPPTQTPMPAPDPIVAPATPGGVAPMPPPMAPTEAVTAAVKDAAAIEAITTTGGPFRVTTDVPLVAQVPGVSCHAAACAAIVAWRDGVKPALGDVASATGYWERYADARSTTYPDVLDAFGLAHAVVGQAPAAAAWRELIERGGPLWVAASPPGEHAVVVSGATGDGTVSGTILDVVDPWARGMTTFGAPNPGSQYHLSLADFLKELAGENAPIVIAQLKEGRPR